MAKAGTREKQFIDLCNKIDNKLLSGKISFSNGEVYVSVDNSIILENEIILIEIDASNQAKLVSGQYTLLNILQDNPTSEIDEEKALIFFVIHCYNKYNPERSKKNFRLINREAFNNKGLKYGSVHIDDIIDDTVNTREKLLSIINENIC